MEAKDGSFGFDFGGIYDDVILHEVIAYTLGDECNLVVLSNVYKPMLVL